MKKIMMFCLVVATLSACSAKQVEPTHQAMDEKASIQYQFAFDFFRNADMIRALAAALKAKEHAPHDADVRNLLGLIYFRRGEAEQAEQEFLFAAKLNPRMSEVHNNLGTLYYELERYEEALASLKRGLENPMYLNPERIHNNMGLVYEALGLVEEAKAEYERAIFLRKNYYLPYQNLAKLHINLGAPAKARPLMEDAVELCSECIEARYLLGTLLMEDGLQEEARQIFQEGYELNPRSYFGQLCGEILQQQ